MRTLKNLDEWFRIYTGAEPQGEIDQIEKFLEDEISASVWPTWSFDLTDDEERKAAAATVWELFTSYMMHAHADAYYQNFGRAPTFEELCLYSEACATVSDVFPD